MSRVCSVNACRLSRLPRRTWARREWHPELCLKAVQILIAPAEVIVPLAHAILVAGCEDQDFSAVLRSLFGGPPLAVCRACAAHGLILPRTKITCPAAARVSNMEERFREALSATRPHGQAYNTRTNSTEYPIWGKDHISSRWYFDSPEQAGCGCEGSQGRVPDWVDLRRSVRSEPVAGSASETR